MKAEATIAVEEVMKPEATIAVEEVMKAGATTEITVAPEITVEMVPGESIAEITVTAATTDVKVVATEEKVIKAIKAIIEAKMIKVISEVTQAW